MGCSKDQFSWIYSDRNPRSQEGSISSLNVNGSWIVTAYENLETGKITLKTNENSGGGMDISIKFYDNTFCGFNTTNEIEGHYILRDTSLKIDVYGGSKVGQPEWGNMFSDSIYSIDSFQRTNSELKLFYNHHKNCVVLNHLRQDLVCTWTYSAY